MILCLAVRPSEAEDSTWNRLADTAQGNIAEASNFQTRARDSWLTTMDHNHLRISRIIRCMRILGKRLHHKKNSIFT